MISIGIGGIGTTLSKINVHQLICQSLMGMLKYISMLVDNAKCI
jgi:hypothetical protein